MVARLIPGRRDQPIKAIQELPEGCRFNSGRVQYSLSWITFLFFGCHLTYLMVEAA